VDPAGIADVAPPPIACTLTTKQAVAERVDDWRTLLARVTRREPTEGGLRLHLPAGPALAADVARLAALELDCCAWLAFELHLDPDATVLEVRAPSAGMDVVVALFGSPD
jgi:hypothetical protein